MPETVYELASTTKPLVATAIMMLVQDGKIKLDAELSQDLKDAPDQWRGITIRHLLSHTSGIKDYLADLRHDFPHDTSPEEFIRSVAKEPLNFRPGARWAYSNTGYVLLGLIVRNVSGLTYDEFLREASIRRAAHGRDATR